MKIPRIIKQRNTYVDRIRPFMRKTLVKVMVGHRRVGKSFILYQLMELIRKEESDANIILSLIHISEPTRSRGISYDGFCF